MEKTVTRGTNIGFTSSSIIWFGRPKDESPSLWTRLYFAATAGNVSAEAIQRYIAMQKGL